MKKIILVLTAVALLATMMMGCQEAPTTEEVKEPVIQAKVLVNISGEIVEINGDKVKLDNGMWVVITDETDFSDDPDNGVEPVDQTLVVGHTIQGYTSDDTEASEVTAERIYSNRPAMKPMGKVAVNISGEIVEVDGDKVKLDNGMWVQMTDETDFSDDPDNGSEPVDKTLVVGNYIVGFTLDDLEQEVVEAYAIYSNGPSN